MCTRDIGFAVNDELKKVMKNMPFNTILKKFVLPKTPCPFPPHPTASTYCFPYTDGSWLKWRAGMSTRGPDWLMALEYKDVTDVV